MIQGEQLKNHTAKFGITQLQAAQWLGISRSLAEHYECGIQKLPAAALIKLAQLEILVADFEKEHGSNELTAGEASLSLLPLHNDKDITTPMHPHPAAEPDKQTNFTGNWYC